MNRPTFPRSLPHTGLSAQAMHPASQVVNGVCREHIIPLCGLARWGAIVGLFENRYTVSIGIGVAIDTKGATIQPLEPVAQQRLLRESL